MKNLILLASLVLLTASSCKKNNCTNATKPKCKETPPTEELCQAAFSRWFYNVKTNQCEVIGYSGCEEYGFATQQDCDDCKCQ